MTTPTVTVREWTDLVRRARLGRTTKAVALMLATYADYTTGHRVRPGLSRLAVDCELGYNAVQAAMRTLREAGLIEMVRPAARRGDADEYRLAIGEQLLDRLEVLSPAAVKVAAAQLGRQRQGRYRPAAENRPDPDPTGGGQGPDLHPAPMGAGDIRACDLHPARRGAEPVDNRHLHPAPMGAGGPMESKPAPLGDARNADLHPSARATCTPRRGVPSPIEQLTRSNPQPVADLDLELTVPRARLPENDIDRSVVEVATEPAPTPAGCGRRNCHGGWLTLGVNRIRCHICQPRTAHATAGAAP